MGPIASLPAGGTGDVGSCVDVLIFGAEFDGAGDADALGLAVVDSPITAIDVVFLVRTVVVVLVCVHVALGGGSTLAGAVDVAVIPLRWDTSMSKSASFESLSLLPSRISSMRLI